jgi:hypothetical protein
MGQSDLIVNGSIHSNQFFGREFRLTVVRVVNDTDINQLVFNDYLGRRNQSIGSIKTKIIRNGEAKSFRATEQVFNRITSIFISAESSPVTVVMFRGPFFNKGGTINISEILAAPPIAIPT